MKKYSIAAVIFISSLVLDVVTKYLIVQNFIVHEKMNLVGSFIQLTLTYNKGGVFGIGQGHQTLFLTLSIVVLALLIAFFIFEKNKTPAFCYSIALITSGAVGNIIDRLISNKGVVDFVYIGFDNKRWPAFNVADMVIVIGAFLLFMVFFKEEKKRKLAEKQESP